MDEIGQGRVWAGTTARRIGLVDRFGGLDAAVAEAARRARLDPAKTRIIYIEKEPSLPFQILDDVLMESAPVQNRDPWSGPVASSRGALLQAFTDAQAIARGPAVQIRCLECGIASKHRAAGNEALLEKLVPVNFK